MVFSTLRLLCDLQCVTLVCFNQRPSLLAIDHVYFAGEAICASVSSSVLLDSVDEHAPGAFVALCKFRL